MTVIDTRPEQLITDNAALQKAVQQLEGQPVLAIDTEFMREKTYFAKLCLLQLATDQHLLLIDPLAELDLSVLSPLLWDPRTVKVCHAGNQDLEILCALLGSPVAPVFDTQIAASLLGLQHQVGLGVLVRHFTQVELKKSDSFSDWTKRPLRTEQLSYALDDVRYLPEIYRIMQAELIKNGRLHWLTSEFEELSDPKRYTHDSEKLLQRLKGTAALNRRQLGILRELATWRDQEARNRDLPRKWLVADEQLVDIARRNPGGADELYRTRGLQERLTTKMTRDILAAVKRGRQLPESELPDKQQRTERRDLTVAIDLMQAIVHRAAAKHQVATSLLAPHSELATIAAGNHQNVSVLQGWRYDLVGKELLKLLRGEITLSLKSGQLQVRESSELQ